MFPRHVIRLAWLAALGNGAAAALTLIVPNVLNGPAVTNGNARGTSLVMLAIATPLLLAAASVARRAAPRASVVVLGALAYFLYNDVMLLFATPFNRLFLVYTTAAALTLFASIEALRTADLWRLAEAFRLIPARPIAAYAGAIVVLNTLGWLATIVPAVLADRPGSFLDPLGLTTNPVYVQDLSFWLPGTAVAAWLLWRRRPAGVLLIGAWLVYGLIESVGVATDQWFGMQADPSVDATPAVVLFIALALVGFVPLFFFMRGQAGPASQPTHATAR